jgi:holo-[acyl-carrier protein] synthase
MIIGIGADILDMNRTSRLLDIYGESAVRRLMLQAEVEYYAKDVHNGFAKIWAAKEAVVKALGGAVSTFSLHDIEITHGKNGEPVVTIHEYNSFHRKISGRANINLTITDELPYVLAFCVVST